MNKKYSLTVGIAAFNEENNIKNIIVDVLLQNSINYTLEKIIIYSDGSTDNTIKNVFEIINRKIKVIDGIHRKGKTAGINAIINASSSELLVFFDADVRIYDKNTIEQIISKFSNGKVALVGGNTLPEKATSFFQRAVNSTFNVFNDSRLALKGGNNVFGCTGGCLALRRDFYKNLFLPRIVNDDDYIYFSALKMGYKFSYQKKAKVYYKLPLHLKDYLKQCFRSNPQAVVINMEKLFGDVVGKEYERPTLFYFKSILKQLLRQPLETIYIIFINAVLLPLYPLIVKRYKLEWFTAVSTK